MELKYDGSLLDGATPSPWDDDESAAELSH